MTGSPDDLAFGALLRQHRQTKGLTQEDLGFLAGVSVRGISDLERGLKLPRMSTLRLLVDGLGLTGDERQRFEAAARSRPDATAAPSTLPKPLTSFVGRAAEIREIGGLVRRRDVRLLLLVGPGGIGKSRLALRVAADQMGAFPDGVHYVRLAALDARGLVDAEVGDLVAGAIADQIGIRPPSEERSGDLLGAYLRDRHVLLVLDNVEHVAAARHRLVDLLEGCPELTLLVTSRTALGIGEHEYAVPPLRRADREPAGHHHQAGDAEALFLERAAAAGEVIPATGEQVGLVSTVCGLLDGLPLAIELAAALLKTQTLPALAHDLGRGPLRTLAAGDDPAHVLRTTISWSYDHLPSDAHRALFRALAVFVGGFTRAAAVAVAGGSGESAQAHLLVLLNQSLIRHLDDAGGERRFGMLGIVREFAAERLAALGEEERTRAAHARFVVEHVQAAEAELYGPDQELWLDRLTADHANTSAAFAWAAEHDDGEAMLRVSAALWRYWTGRGRRREGRDWLERALAAGGDAAPALRAKALKGLGNLAVDRGDFAEARKRHEAGLALQREAGDDVGIANALDALGLVAFEQGEIELARRWAEEAYEIRKGYPEDRRGLALSAYNLADVAREEGDYPRARPLYEQALAGFRALDDRSTIAYVLLALGICLRWQAEARTAAPLLNESLELFRRLGDNHAAGSVLAERGRLALTVGNPEVAAQNFATALTSERDTEGPEMEHNWIEAVEGLGWVAQRRGDVTGAARLLAAADAHRAARGLPFPSRADREQHERAVRELKAETGQAWDEAWRLGALLSREQAIAEALRGRARPP